MGEDRSQVTLFPEAVDDYIVDADLKRQKADGIA